MQTSKLLMGTLFAIRSRKFTARDLAFSDLKPYVETATSESYTYFALKYRVPKLPQKLFRQGHEIFP